MTTDKTLLALAVATIMALTSVTASAQDLGDDEFDQMLGALDTVPTKARLDARWSDAPQRLMAAALDPSRSVAIRSRALTMLSNYPTPETRKLLTGLAEDPEVRIRKLAVYTLARTFGTPGDTELVAFLVDKAHSDDHAKVRKFAVRGLRWVDHASAASALETLREQKKDPELASLADYVLKRRSDRLNP